MPPRGRPRKFDRADALQRAMITFWAHGYDGTSMAQLSHAMGLNSPSIYAAFGSKEKLFQEAVDLYLSTEGGRIWSATKAEPSARGAVEMMLRTSAEEFTQSGKPGGCLIILGALNEDEGNAGVHKKLRAQRAQTTATLTRILEEAVKAGDINRSVDVQAIADYYITIQQGMSIKARDGASRNALLAVANVAMTTWDALVD